jgi:Fe-S-cluster-containing dehydrogenase component
VCELACSFTHEGVFQPSLSRIRVYRLDGQGVHFPVACLDCADPPCVAACPTAACHIDRGIPVVRVDEALCIGCRECVVACPFGAAHFNSSKGKAYQCDLCDGDPACVPQCYPGALHFEPVERTAARKGRARAERRIFASTPGLPVSGASGGQR